MSAAESLDCLVLGGGPAGLSTALALQRHGRAAHVVEKAGEVGGLARTVVHDGFRFDLGGHRFYTKNRQVQQFVEGLLGDELLLVPRRSTIHFRGRFVDYPIKPWNALANVGPLTAARIACDLLRLTWRGRRAAPASLQDWMLAAYGRTLFETYFKVYAEKVWGMPAARIDAGLAAQRVKGLDLWDTVRNALWPKSRRAVESLVERFHYPRLGYGEISLAMARELGGNVELRCEPTALRHDGRRIVEVDLRDAAGATRTVAPEHVIATIPITRVCELMTPAPPAPVQAAAAALGFRAVVFVAVFVDQETVRPESWIYFPSPAISFGRITEPRNWSASMAPAGRTSVVAEHFCDVGDATWRQTDEQLAARTVHDLVQTLGLLPKERVLGWRVVRAARAYPRMDVDHHRHLAVIEGWLDRFDNLQLVGRAGMYRYHNTDHVIEAGLAAAQNVLGADHDLRAINQELAYHEQRTVP